MSTILATSIGLLLGFIIAYWVLSCGIFKRRIYTLKKDKVYLIKEISILKEQMASLEASMDDQATRMIRFHKLLDKQNKNFTPKFTIRGAHDYNKRKSAN